MRKQLEQRIKRLLHARLGGLLSLSLSLSGEIGANSGADVGSPMTRVRVSVAVS